MNRRTLLKGAAVGAGMMLPARAAVHRASAQAPSYIAEVIYQFTEFTETEYRMDRDGYFTRVSSDGVIAGRDVVGGVTVPVTWNLTGARTELDTGDLAFAKTGGVYAATNGFIAGNLYEAANAEAPGVGVLWTDGVISRLAGEVGAGMSVSTVNGQGIVAGSMDSAPCRWAASEMELLPIPDGATRAEVTRLSENGDGYVIARGPEGILGNPSIWRTDGTVDEITLPAELTAPEVTQIDFISFPGVFADGGFVLRSTWTLGADQATACWLYEGGVPTLIANNGGTTMAAVASAESPGAMVGSIFRGNEPSEQAGPAQWIDGVSMLLEPVTTLPDGVSIDTLNGMTMDGTLVGWAGTFDNDPLTPPSILVLRPTS